MIHGHGDDLYKSQVQIKANFSTNVWYEADTRPLCDFLSTHLEGIFHYPEPDAGSFRKVAAAYHGLTPEQVLVGNGATELFYMVAHAFSGNRTLIPVPSFTEYEDACTLYDHHIQFVGQVDVEHIPEHTNLMFICNPNNPDGRIWSLEEITALVKNYPDMVLVVDESFIHFAPGTESALSLLKEYSNLLVIKSMTKCYAIPGLRLGYMLGNPAIVEFVACFGQPWSVNALAIEAGEILAPAWRGRFAGCFFVKDPAAGVRCTNGPNFRIPSLAFGNVFFSRRNGLQQFGFKEISVGETWTIDSGCFQFQRIGHALF